VTADAVRSALSQSSEVYACLMPFEQKELIRLVLRKTEVGQRQIVLALRGTLTVKMATAQSHSRSKPPNWLPGRVAIATLQANGPPRTVLQIAVRHTRNSRSVGTFERHSL